MNPPLGVATGMSSSAPSPLRAAVPLDSVWAGTRYGALAFALAFLALPLYVNLPEHYASVHGLSLTLLGVVLLGTRVLDALLDPFIGQAVDAAFLRSPGAVWWLAALSALGVGAGFALLFNLPVGTPGLLAWLVGALLLAYIALSVLTVVHQAWGMRLGGDGLQRSRVVAWREGFGLVGVLVASVLPSQVGLPMTTTVLLVALALGIALLAWAPRATRAAQAGIERSAEARAWALPWRVRGFRRLITVFLFNGIASAVPATLVLFFVRDQLQLPDTQALFLGAYFACAMAAVPLWVRGVRAWGLARAWLAGMALAMLAFVGVLALGPGDLVGFLLVCVVSGAALGADLTIPGAMLAGVVQRADTGGQGAGQGEGLYVGWWNSATKLNLGLAAGLALPLLALAGYAPGARDPQALQALSLAYVVVPSALKGVAAALLWHWWIKNGEIE